ncbi:MAG: hypothetical protein H7Y07_14895 [Pyrinomonadaceae bacterium]|nr:hypothetical protein [Sphingobacteriaceae bacterium]
MYDFVKISFSSNQYAEYLRHNKYLTFVKESKKTYSANHTYSYNGLVFDIYDSGRIILTGSLHKYWNQGEHNHNDFGYQQLLTVISDLTGKFTPYLLSGEVNNIEVGINITPRFRASEYLKTVIGLKGAERHPITRNDLKGFQKGYHFQKTQWGLKIYDKGKQYNRLENIIRHELKTYKMQAIQDIGIKTVIDLCDLNKLCRAVDSLLQAYKDVLIAEVVEISNLSRNHERIYLECVNTDSWNDWTKDKRCKRLSQFNRIISNYGQTDIKTSVTDLMSEKASSLLIHTPESINLFTDIQKTYTDLLSWTSINQFTINIIGKNVDPTYPERVCFSCGKDISNQDKKSKFCSAKYVGYEQAHKCRNQATNTKNNLNKKIQLITSKGVLFPIESFLKIPLK